MSGTSGFSQNLYITVNIEDIIKLALTFASVSRICIRAETVLRDLKMLGM